MPTPRPALTCQKCGFIRRDAAVITPRLACPQCGAIYAKVEEALQARADAQARSTATAAPSRRVRTGKLVGLVVLAITLVLLAVGGPLSGEYGPRHRTTNTIPTLVNAVGEGWVRLYLAVAVVLWMVYLWRTRHDAQEPPTDEQRAAQRDRRQQLQQRRNRFMLGLVGVGFLYILGHALLAEPADEADYPKDWPRIDRPWWPWACPDLSGRYRTLPPEPQKQAAGGAFRSQPFALGRGQLPEIDVVVSGPAEGQLRVVVGNWRPLSFRQPKCSSGWVLLGEQGRADQPAYGTGAYVMEAWARSVDGRLIGRQTLYTTGSLLSWGGQSYGRMTTTSERNFFMQLRPLPKDGALGKP